MILEVLSGALMAGILYHFIHGLMVRIQELEHMIIEIVNKYNNLSYQIDQTAFDFTDYMANFWHVDKDMNGEIIYRKIELTPEEELRLIKQREALRKEGIARGLIASETVDVSPDQD